MPSCIICHTDIDESKENTYKCPNDHLVHEFCLSEWIPHSENCPHCEIKYDSYIISKCKNFLEKKSKEKEVSLKDQWKQQKASKIEKVAEKIAFLKFVENIEGLIEKEEYDTALIKLDSINIEILSEGNNQMAIFLNGKIFYFKGRYDMAIGHLFKLVKQRFDYPEAFLYLGKSYQKLGLMDKAQWAFDRAK